MLVSHTNKFIYIKTVKTAGTSIEVALQENCVAPGQTLDEATPMLESEYGIVGARGQNVGGERWYNHMPAAAIRRQLPAEVWDGYCKICNIRNPWDKTVSWYHFKNPDVKNKPEAEIVAGFRRWLAEEDPARIGHDRGIYFIAGAPVADEYIRYETLSEDYSRICRKLGIVEHPIPELKTAQRGKKDIPYQKYYDAELRDRIAALYDKEIGVFGWDF